MSTIIIDASVGLKWFVPEVHSLEAHYWRGPSHELHTLAVFFEIEIANVLWKKVQRAQLTFPEAAQIAMEFPALALQRHAESSLIPSALDLAQQINRTVYDSLYLALAVQLNGRMVTADLRLHNSISATAFAKHIAWIADISPP
ncbi:MAG TPA: type II toxin-antitoxin system VapC family toxin [Pirellulaceae bacterium]